MSEIPAEADAMTQDSPAQTPDRTPPPSSSPPAKKKKRSHFGFWFILLLLILLGAGGWFGYQLWLELQALRGGLEQQVKGLEHNGQQLQQQLGDLKAEKQSLQQDLETLHAQYQGLEKSMRSLYREQRKAGDEQDWSIAEVLYLLSAAHQRLLLAQDVPAALAALQAADKRLQHFTDPRFLNVREQLAKDMNKLRTLESADINGMALRLRQALANIDDFPLLQGQQASTMSLDEVTASETASSEAQPSWQAMLDAVWKEAQSLVTIRYNNSGDVGLLAPEQRYFLRQNLRLKLETARFALLRQDTKLFHSALEQVQEWLNRYYDVSDAQVKLLLSEVANMQSQELAPPLPDISASLKALQALANEGDIAAPMPAAEEKTATDAGNTP